MLSTSIVVPRDLVLDKTRTQHLALLFDEILIWKWAREEVTDEQHKKMQSESQDLVALGVARRLGMHDMLQLGGVDVMAADSELVVRWGGNRLEGDLLEGPEGVDREVRSLAHAVSYYGVRATAHAAPSSLGAPGRDSACLQVTLHNMPLPPADMPWSELIQFRNDQENQFHLRGLRVFLQKLARDESSPQLINDEIRHLLDEYTRYSKLQNKKFNYATLTTLLVSIPEIVIGLATKIYPLAAHGILDIQARNAQLAQDELTAPGREVAYISRVAEQIGGR